jgi:hypothetical protein
MRKRMSLPGQLALNFESTYLNWIEFKGEKFADYEAATEKIFTAPIREEVSSPIWQEIVCALNRGN